MRECIYIFIDTQNLLLGFKSLGYELSLQRLFVYLKNKFRATNIILYIGFIKHNHILYRNLESIGYKIIFKPTIRNKDGTYKANVDAEIVLSSAKLLFNEYDKAIIISGDGDFYCLYEFLIEERKLAHIIIPNKRSESQLLKRFSKYKIFLERDLPLLKK